MAKRLRVYLFMLLVFFFDNLPLCDKRVADRIPNLASGRFN